MNSTQWQRVQRIVEQAAELPAGERTRLITAETEEDPELQREIEGMLRCFDATGSFLEDAIGIAAASVAAGKELAAGDRIGAYVITSKIGQGGMGIVYRAQRADEQYRQSVAIKVVRAGWGSTEELFARFRAERQILAGINHPNISRLLDGGITGDGLPFLVMEFVEGVALDQWIARKSPLLGARLDLFGKLCSAIQYAHQNLIVHRDLKPGNILVSEDGTPKLLDFGIAKLLDIEVVSGQTVVLTRAAERLMTPEYASPEQIRGQNITTATDIYGLGVLLYEILTGLRPFNLRNLSPGEMERMVCETQPRLPSSVGLSGRKADGESQTGTVAIVKPGRSTDLDRIVLKAMHKEPSRRYASAADLAADVERYQEGFPVSARADSFAYRSTRFLQRNKLASAATALFFLTVITLSVVSLVQARRARREAASADAVSQYLAGLFDQTQPNSTQGRDVSARQLLDQGTERLQKEWNADPLVKARLLDTVGTVYFRLGALDQGISLVGEAARIYSEQTGPDSLEVARTARDLGEILESKGEFDLCLQQYSRALTIYEKKKGHNSVEVAEQLNAMGSIHQHMGDYKGAEKFQRESISIFTRLLGPGATETLGSKGNLEVLLERAGNYREAEPLAREMLRERSRIYGPYNSSTNYALQNLEHLLVKTGHLSEAKPMIDRMLAVFRKIDGEEHLDVGAALVDEGRWYFKTGHFEVAKQFLEQGLGMATRTTGLQSTDTAYDEEIMGLLLLQEGDLQEARELIEKDIAVLLGKAVPSQPLLADGYDHLGLIALDEGNLADARAQLEKALQMRLKFFKWENDMVASSYLHLGRLELAEGQPAKAEEDFKHASSIAQALFGEDPHPIKVEALKGLSLGEAALGRQAEARSDLAGVRNMQQALGIAQNTADEQKIVFNDAI